MIRYNRYNQFTSRACKREEIPVKQIDPQCLLDAQSGSDGNNLTISFPPSRQKFSSTVDLIDCSTVLTDLPLGLLGDGSDGNRQVRKQQDMAFGWCTGTKSVRTYSTNLGTLPQAEDLPRPTQQPPNQSNCFSSPAHTSFVKLNSSNLGYAILPVQIFQIDSLQGCSSSGQIHCDCRQTGGSQVDTTPTSVLETSNSPDPLRNHARYVKVAELGLGSSAFVLLAEDREKMRDVAIKFISRGSNR